MPFGMGFDQITWSFFEASHGEGAPDEVGGAVKRAADRCVACGIDVANPKMLYDQLIQKGSAIRLFYVPDTVTKNLPTLPTVPGTMSLHQMVCSSEKILTYQDVSCFCSPMSS